MRQNPEFYELCCKSDKIPFETCKKNNTLTMYKCHAGLIEATDMAIADIAQIVSFPDYNYFLKSFTSTRIIRKKEIDFIKNL